MPRSPGCDLSLPVPLVIVQGFLGNGSWLWGDFEEYLNEDCKIPRRVIFVSIGPVSSLHDRACELYYALVGGTVDYGEAHATAHGHARFGRRIPQGQYPEWSIHHPLHFLGHSIGGATVMKLQFLAKRGHFGPNAHSNMVLSLNAVSTPFRGTPLVYALGERADAAPAVRPFSIGAFVGKWVHLLSFFAPFLPAALDMHGDARSLTYRDISVFALIRQLWKSDWAESRDATPFDVTFQAAEERETMGEGMVEPETYYQSHVGWMTRRSSDSSSTHVPIRLSSSPFTYISSRIVGSFEYSTLKPAPKFCRVESRMGEEYWANDGVVPVMSQCHPFSCDETRCIHLSGSEPTQLELEPGVWYVKGEEDTHHTALIPWWTGSSSQQEFWTKLSRWLATVEANASRL
ncbi:alpha/beta-hydrolase [Mycena amicta]|nr:alpha/beta-hydrolase [Mycena amicta]